MTEETLGQLIKRLRHEKGDMTQGQLAVKASLPREWLSVVEVDGIKKPDRERLERIAVALEVPPTLLLRAAGYRVGPLPPRLRRTPQEIARELEVSLRDQPIAVPEVEQLTSAGPGAISEPERWFYYPEPGERGHNFVAVRVHGTCMEPLIHDGEGVIVDKDASPMPGDIVAAIHEGNNIVKQLDQRSDGLYLVALQEQPPLKIDGETRILGVVRFAGRRVKRKGW